MNRRAFVAMTGATLASVGLAGCTGLSDDENDDTDAADELDWEEIEAELGQTPDSIELVDSHLVETQDGAAVIGTLRNTGEMPYSFLEVEVTLNDDDTLLGEWIDTTEEEIDDLDAGESWRFVATFENENVYEATKYTINVSGDVEDAEGDGTGNSS